MDGSQGTAGAGHNAMGGVDEAIFARHVNAIAAADAVCEEANAKRKKARQAAKADGITPKDLDRALIIAEMSSDEQHQYLATQKQYLEWLRVPIGTQLSLLDQSPLETDEDIAADLIKKSAGDGYRAGLTGKWQDDNPHDPTTPAGQAWIKGWHDGQKATVEQNIQRAEPEGDDE